MKLTIYGITCCVVNEHIYIQYISVNLEKLLHFGI